MFRILCDPSSGSTELCLTEITRSDSQIFCRVLGRCLAAYFLNLWCVCVYGPAGCAEEAYFQSQDRQFVIEKNWHCGITNFASSP